MGTRRNSLSLRDWLAFSLISLQLVLMGCSDDGRSTGRVHGEITIDGTPLAEGQIRFFAVDGGIGSDGVVTIGKYDIAARDGLCGGKYRVEISFEKKTGKKVPDRDGGPGDMKEEVIESLPAKYNKNSTLQIDYDPKALKPYDFKL